MFLSVIIIVAVVVGGYFDYIYLIEIVLMCACKKLFSLTVSVLIKIPGT